MWTTLSSEVLAIALLAILLMIPLAVRVVQGHFDPFEPTVTFSVAWAVLFVARPVGMLMTNSFSASTYQVRQGFDGMLLMALVGTLGFLIGYGAPIGRAFATKVRPLPEPGRAGAAVMYALTVSIIGVVLFGAFIATSGGLATLQALMAGQQENLVVFLQTSSTAYLSGALALTFPASMLIFYLAISRRSVVLLRAPASRLL